MAFAADPHLPSRYAYACSKNLTLANTALWAKAKGIELLSTADFEIGGARLVLGRRSAVSTSKSAAPDEFIVGLRPNI